MVSRVGILIGLAAILTAPGTAGAADLPLDTITLPEGFSISVYAENLENARALAWGDNGALFVSTMRAGKVYAVVDTDGDFKADKTYEIAGDLHTPNGVAFKDGALYVAEINRILRFDGIESSLEKPPAPVVVNDGFPTAEMHGWKYIAFGPDGKLYLNVGAPCNSCDPSGDDERYATIMRVGADGANPEIFARGVRNSVGFSWHPVSKELYFTDNGRDMLGDDTPECELNRATAPGQHFGFPYIHCGDVPDPDHGAGHTPSEFVPPVAKMGPHNAPLGMKFYTGSQFPEEYKNNIFVAKHGSWNRSIPSGYEVARVKLDGAGNSAGVESFATGWLQRTKAWGRPVDVIVAEDGALLVSDDQNGVVYRIAYAAK
ncbi:MAG: sorbosone dehydrogenase family protein [Candidatus Hydrogenedentes bacterium]|nr:sorbosone dehydrogenase family protein [Candidatus Hydrogenedentota bacterium]